LKQTTNPRLTLPLLVAIARGQEPSAALDDLKKLLAERQVAILAGAHIIVRVEKVGRVLCFVL
jgi:hypothetical protein